MAAYHQQFETGNPLKTLEVTSETFKVMTDHEQRMADRMNPCANLAVTVPTRTLSRSTSPRGWHHHRCCLLPLKSKTTE